VQGNLAAQVGQVGLGVTQRRVEQQFFDDRQEVMQRAKRPKRKGVGTAGGGEQECSFNGGEGSLALAGEEVEGEDALDQGATDSLGPTPLEVSHEFEPAQPDLREAAFQGAADRGFGFGASDFFQELARTSAPGGGAGHEVVERVGGEDRPSCFN
jgi:hypothetical protein